MEPDTVSTPKINKSTFSFGGSLMKRVSNNERKITVLKNIIRTRRNNIGENNSKPSIISMFPIFIIGFILMGLIRSIGDYGIQNSNLAFELLNNNNWQLIIKIIKSVAEYSLAIAMAAVGISTNLVSLKSLGIRPFYVGFSAACCVGIVSYIGIIILNNFI